MFYILDNIPTHCNAWHVLRIGTDYFLFLSNFASQNKLSQSGLDYVLLIEFLESHPSNCF